MTEIKFEFLEKQDPSLYSLWERLQNAENVEELLLLYMTSEPPDPSIETWRDRNCIMAALAISNGLISDKASYSRIVEKRLEKGGKIFPPLGMVILEVMQFFPVNLLHRDSCRKFIRDTQEHAFESSKNCLEVINRRMREI